MDIYRKRNSKSIFILLLITLVLSINIFKGGNKMSSKDWWVFPGFEIELKAEDLNLPVNLAFNPNKESNAQLYVTELYGSGKGNNKRLENIHLC